MRRTVSAARSSGSMSVSSSPLSATSRRGMPFSTISRVDRAPLEQLLVRAERGDAAVFHHDDPVREHDRRQAVGDHEGRAPLHHLAKRTLDLALGGGVDARGRVVEDQHAWVGDQRTRDRDPLALPAGQREPALAHERVVAVRERLDEGVDLRSPCGELDVRRRRIRPRVGDVLAHARGEQEAVVGHQRDRARAAHPDRSRARRGRRSRPTRSSRRRAARSTRRASSCRTRSARRPRSSRPAGRRASRPSSAGAPPS